MGKGGGGIGAMGAGGVGKGPVRAGVQRAASDRVSSQGQIDKEAVAKAINSHLAEVQRCYEAALLKNPGLAGKVVLEWSISTQGRVVSSKTKSSTLKDSSVETCILRSLNTWQFPPARGVVGDHQLPIHLQRGGLLNEAAALEASVAGSPTVQDTT